MNESDSILHDPSPEAATLGSLEVARMFSRALDAETDPWVAAALWSEVAYFADRRMACMRARGNARIDARIAEAKAAQ